MPTSTSLRNTVLAGAVLAAGMLSACGPNGAKETSSESHVYDEAITSIELESSGGNIEVKAGDVDKVEVEREFRWNDEKPASAETVDDGTLRVSTQGCGGLNSNSCSISYEFTVPHDVDVDLDTEAGNIDLTGLQGKVLAHTDAGNVVGTGLAAKEAEVGTDAGNVDIRVAGEADKIEASTDAGNVTVNLAVPAKEVEANSDAGNVAVVVPDDGTEYKVDAGTSAGKMSIEVPENDESERTIEAKTDAGNVRVDFR
ncbi:DUF4097 family beta strand repeat-containing protein [Salininema proteolyticum]|uniref:DUF4097 family beta strand repeat-containing protein n=1 Tax=Salininema proteolyticum TaxID=1607685 RepID=A0ABV8TX59_9ACTN